MNKEGDTLRFAIKKAKLTQDSFAASMGFSRNYLLRLMEKDTLPVEVKQKAAGILKQPVDVLFGVQMHTVEDAGVTYYTAKDLSGLNEKYIAALERQVATLEKQIELQNEIIELLRAKSGQ